MFEDSKHPVHGGNGRWTVEEQLAIYLTNAHAIELQALVQVERAQEIAGDPELADAFANHVDETKRHERFVRARLEALG